MRTETYIFAGNSNWYSMLPSFRTERTLFDYFHRSFKYSSTEEFQK